MIWIVFFFIFFSNFLENLGTYPSTDPEGAPALPLLLPMVVNTDRGGNGRLGSRSTIISFLIIGLDDFVDSGGVCCSISEG